MQSQHSAPFSADAYPAFSLSYDWTLFFSLSPKWGMIFYSDNIKQYANSPSSLVNISDLL
jgi:hypothetical protein